MTHPASPPTEPTESRTPAPSGIRAFFAVGGLAAWMTVAGIPALIAASAWLAVDVEHARFRRDITRTGYDDNLAMLDSTRRAAAEVGETLAEAKLASTADIAAGKAPYVVVSIADNRLWLKLGNAVLYTTRVATGTGKNLEQTNGGRTWKFETPRGRLFVERKDVDPAWVPPDWHYVEVAEKKQLTPFHLQKGKPLPVGGGAVLTVIGNDVVTQLSDGRVQPFEVREGHEIRVGKLLIIPPYGTNQRQYFGTLGSNRLYLGDGYGLHGTDVPSSIGRAASHGCVRLRNEDAELLYRVVPLGTPVYIY